MWLASCAGDVWAGPQKLLSIAQGVMYLVEEGATRMTMLMLSQGKRRCPSVLTFRGGRRRNTALVSQDPHRVAGSALCEAISCNAQSLGLVLAFFCIMKTSVLYLRLRRVLIQAAAMRPGFVRDNAARHTARRLASCVVQATSHGVR